MQTKYAYKRQTSFKKIFLKDWKETTNIFIVISFP